ncbi:TolC family protein [Allosphingosinicella indica]|uniref:Outer membrane protein, adhesin transport system n=1 Tax=Allosphingosinicella indica TaxID=941907 RepID=A0A1X7G0N3_9SPHN|nr:TolC family protein [Allosphingosinicella indica]SMF61826.1 outer membrane protein, adhesin transport system [Allosphingosinicella indica]
MPVSLIALAAMLAAQTPGAENPLSQLPPMTGDPRATTRERDPVAPPSTALPQPAPPSGNVAVTPAPVPSVAMQPAPSLGTPGVPRERQPAMVDGQLQRLPQPIADPLRINREGDPILGLARTSVSPSEFTELVGQAVARSPAVNEAEANITQAEAARKQATAQRWPTVDLGLNTSTSFARSFDVDNIDVIVERARSRSRTDATINAEQTIWDFGATENRVSAAGARLRAAAFDAQASADDVTLRAIAAWYDVFAYRALVRLASAFTGSQGDLRAAIQTRIRQGVSAPGDLPRVESYIAAAETDLARFRRQLANAEARFEEIYGLPAPADLGRAPILGSESTSKDAAQLLARSSPGVQSAEASARGARQDARAERASTYPRISGGLDIGRYGVFEGDNYDVRGRVTVRQRLFGGVNARAEQAEARAAAFSARADRVRAEAEREASIAWSDVQALQQQLAALEDSYLAGRQSRDVLAERFSVARGTLFDLLDSESSYFTTAASYIRAITELDAARYVLLSRTGQLLTTLNIAPPAPEAQ